jgi:hypothetical protein
MEGESYHALLYKSLPALFLLDFLKHESQEGTKDRVMSDPRNMIPVEKGFGEWVMMRVKKAGSEDGHVLHVTFSLT